MICKNKMCIYQKDNACTLDEIEIDWRGTCKNWRNARIGKERLEYSKLCTCLMAKNTENFTFDEETGDYSYIEPKNRDFSDDLV